MDLINFLERNFEKEGLSEDRNNEINKLFDNLIRETPKPKKGFSVREFLMEMDDSDPEWREETDDEMDEEEIEDGEIVDGEIEDGEIENTEPIPMADPIPIFEEFEEENQEMEEREDPEEENEDLDQREDENGEDEEENIDPEREEYDSRVRSFPAGVRLESTNCKKCKLPYSKKSLKRHLMDKHQIDAASVEDYSDTFTVLPTFRKLQLNKKTGKPEVKVRFTGKKNKIKNDIFPTGQLWGLKSFRKSIKDLTKNGPKREKKIALSEQIKREKKLRKVAVNRFGRFAQENRYECSICKKRKRAFNASVMCHTNDDNVVPHTFCTPCLIRWTKKNNNSCPLCRSPGVPIKIYHN